MKRIIYEPAIGDIAPDESVQYTLPASEKLVIDAIVANDFAPAAGGIVRYDSLAEIELDEPFVHHFAGWEPIITLSEVVL